MQGQRKGKTFYRNVGKLLSDYAASHFGDPMLCSYSHHGAKFRSYIFSYTIGELHASCSMVMILMSQFYFK